jgi:hypothetical protein
MTIDAMARSSDIASIHRHFSQLRIDDEGVDFRTFMSKEVRLSRGAVRFSRWLKIDAYEVDPNICTVHNLNHYLRRSVGRHQPLPTDRTISSSSSPEPIHTCTLFLSLPSPGGQPLRSLSSDSIARILRDALRLVGMPKDFGAHSFRAAAASKAFAAGVSVDRIMAQGRWSSESVLRKHYIRSSPPSVPPSSTVSLVHALRS